MQPMLEAICTLAEASICHRDIKWPHLALIPICDRDELPSRLEPILIDLSDVEMCSSRVEALDKINVYRVFSADH